MDVGAHVWSGSLHSLVELRLFAVQSNGLELQHGLQHPIERSPRRRTKVRIIRAEIKLTQITRPLSQVGLNAGYKACLTDMLENGHIDVEIIVYGLADPEDCSFGTWGPNFTCHAIRSRSLRDWMHSSGGPELRGHITAVKVVATTNFTSSVCTGHSAASEMSFLEPRGIGSPSWLYAQQNMKVTFVARKSERKIRPQTFEYGGYINVEFEEPLELQVGHELSEIPLPF